MSLSLYIHIPFCIHKCSYCDFFSLGVGQAEIPAAQYMARLTTELRVIVEELGLHGRELGSIFFGGGTPSMIPPALLGKFLTDVAHHFSVPADCEITCEANPETLDAERLSGMLGAGINRLSIGVQSFQPRHLKFLERVHSVERAAEAIQTAHAVGFTNINLDLIFGLPDQTMAELDDDLDRALALQTHHLSAYQLTVEPRTPLAVQVAQGKVVPIADERSLQMWHRVRERLCAAGFAAYEVSNYARPGSECRHNLHYWRFGEYLGLGTGAVSRIGDQRWRRARILKRYLAGDLLRDDCESLDGPTRRFEYIMLALRTSTGLSRANFVAHFDKPFDHYYPGVRERWVQSGYATDSESLRLTPQGLALLDSLLAAV